MSEPSGARVPLRVLIVDDDPFVAELHRAFLDELPRFVVAGVAGTGPEAVTAIRTQHPDIVLLDMYLPGFSGIEVLRAIRAEARLQPEVVAVTAARDVGTVRDARRAGVRHYLAKPFAAAELRARLLEIEGELRTTARESSLQQSQIDELMAPVGRAASLPKGLSKETLDTVHAALRSAGSVTAHELGESLGLSRVSCRRYLEHLVNGGAASRSLDYSTSGRPSTRYAAASEPVPRQGLEP